jgi:hypothetical protein
MTSLQPLHVRIAVGIIRRKSPGCNSMEFLHRFRQPKKTGRNEIKATKKCAQPKNSVRHSRYFYELAADLSRKFSLHRKPSPG